RKHLERGISIAHEHSNAVDAHNAAETSFVALAHGAVPAPVRGSSSIPTHPPINLHAAARYVHSDIPKDSTPHPAAERRHKLSAYKHQDAAAATSARPEA